tara:strand:- start:624 stop:923 length:300 start_codon:yes stop_codon:yes gene_type:complete
MATKRKKSRRTRRSCKHGKLKRQVRTKSGRKRKCKKQRRKSSKSRKKKGSRTRKRSRKHKLVTFTSYSGGSNLGISTDGTLSYGYSDPNTRLDANCTIL